MLNCKQIRLGLLHSYKLFYYFFQFNNNNCEKRSRYISTKKYHMNLRIGLHFPRSELLSVLEIRLDFELATLNQIMTVDHAERKGQKLTPAVVVANIYYCYYVGVWSEKNDTLTSVEMYRKYLVMLYFCIIIQDVLCYSFLPGYRIGKIIYFTTDSIPTTANVPCCVLL